MVTPFERLYAVMTRPLVIACWLLMTTVVWFYLDRPLADFFAGLELHTNAVPLAWFTMLGTRAFYITLYLTAALYFRYFRVNPEWEARCWFLFICVLIPEIICGVLKVSLGRARPDMWFQEQFYGFYGFQAKSAFWSFPSGHTTTIMGVTLGAGILFPRYCYALVTAGLLVAVSRVLLVQHYLSDIMSASYLVLIEVGLLQYFLRANSRSALIFRGVLGKS